MLANLTPFLLHWAITALALWVASHLFKGIRFGSTSALVVSALLLGLANAVVRPLLVVLTLPLTLLSFGFFLLVINMTYSLFDTFGVIDVIVKDKAANNPITLVYKVYLDGFRGNDLGSSSAQSVILMVIVLVLTMIQFRFIERRVHYG